MTELPAVGEGTTLDLLPAAGAAGGGPAGPAPALERLVVLGRLGAGGMGTVWRARQLGLGREVALKVLSGHRLDSLEARERFHLEAVAAANLDHPGIVRVHAFGEHAGLPWFVMELVEGPSLARLLEEGGPPGPLQAARWVAEAARAVDHAHRRGVVHRDLKPANLLLGGDGRLRVTDFGVARVEGPLAGAVPREPTEEGISLGTPAYMAPEQRLGDRRRVGPTTDVYALGLVLRECAGEPPGAGLEAVVRRATAFQPEARYPTALALAEDLEAWLATQPRERPLRAAAWPRWRRLAAALASVAAFGAAAGVGAWRGSPGAPEVAGAPAGRGGAARTALAREALGRPLETRAALEEALAADPADREALEAFVLWAAIHQEPARAGTAWRRLERLHDAASFAGLGERVGHLPGVSREEFVRRVASRWELPAPGEPRHGAGAAAAPGVLWLAGGTGTAGRPLGEVLRFDLAAWRWERLPSLPGEEGPAGPVALVALGGDLYALAGAGLLALPAGAAGWERLPPPPTPRARLGATALEGRLYAVGGLDGRGQALATVEVYDPAAGRWSAGPPLPSPRSDLGVASLDGSLVAAGGADTEGHYRAEGWRLETRTWTWTPIPPLPEPLRALALASDGRRLHAVGGYGPGGPSGRVLVWARGEAAWREAARLPSAREYAAAAADPTEGLYVVGGYRGGEVEGDAWVFRVD